MSAKVKEKIKAPGHLKRMTQIWYRRVCGDYKLEPHHLRLLQLCCEAWDRAQEARETIVKEGAIYHTRFDEPRPHPSIAIERDSMTTFARLLRELNLDAEDPPDSRPPGLTYP